MNKYKCWIQNKKEKKKIKKNKILILKILKYKKINKKFLKHKFNYNIKINFLLNY